MAGEFAGFPIVRYICWCSCSVACSQRGQSRVQMDAVLHMAPGFWANAFAVGRRLGVACVH